MTEPSAKGPKTALLLQKLREKKGGESGAPPRPAEGITRRQGEGPWPLSFGQERMWLLDQMRPGSSAFNMPFALRLTGALEVAVLEQALRELVARHESLRTIFSSRDGLPAQEILPPAFRLALADLTALPAGEREEEAARRRDHDAAAPFELASGPLFRASLLRLEATAHLLLLNFHHSIFDGWSSGIFFRELATLLADFGAGRPSSLPAPALQYADFAIWQRQQLQGERLDRQLAYWKNQLAGATPVLSLPLDRPRLPRAERRGAFAYGKVEAATVAVLRQLAQENRSPIFPLLLSAFQVLLARLCGQDDILIGIPVVDRPRTELENTIGFFLNTLVIRNQIDLARPFAELFAATRDTVLAAREHQLIPFEKLVLELQPERSTSQTPFFQVLFNYANLPDAQFTLPGLTVTSEATENLAAKVDLNLYLFDAEKGLDLQLVYDADLFDRARMNELLRQFSSLLAAVAAQPQRKAGAYSLRTEVAARHLPDPAAPLPSEFRGTIAEAFGRQCAARPQHPAIEDPATTWSYAELNARSAAVAARLAAEGIARGEVVAIWAHRSAALVESLLGILRAGAAFVVFDPAYPLTRLFDYLELARPRLLIALAAAGPLPLPLETAALEAGVRLLSLPEKGFAPAPGGFTSPALDGDDLAYVAFTSGSTGKPKAILGRHASLTAFLPFIAENFGLGRDDRHSLLSALSHDPLHRDVLMPLYFGATLVIPDPEQLMSPGYLPGWVAAQRLTLLNLVPAMLQLLVHPVAGGPTSLPGLRRVFTVGDVLQRADVDALYALAPAATVINLYGSTETQRAVSYVVLPRQLDHLSEEDELGTRGLLKASLPVGRGYPGVQLVLLGSQGEWTGVGEVGEIYMRSFYLARGYQDPEQTRERFLTNPWGTSPADRLYRTGDLGRYLPDGQVEFLGRADFQVKIRGFRIELQEVEAALARLPGIDSCVVVVRDEQGGEKRLIAYYVPRAEETELSTRELRAELLARLPDYMVPSVFVALKALPLTQTGKLDRMALPPPPREESAHDFKAPANAYEEELASLWASLLGRERIGTLDNFFELGGHSLLATRLLARIRDAFGVNLPLRDLFEAPTVAGLAAQLQRLGQQNFAAPPLTRAPGPPNSSPLGAAGRGPLPLSFAQQRLWFLDLLDPGATAYLLCGAVALHGELDPAALAAAFSRLAERHEALRTRIETVDGEGRQVVAPAEAWPIPLLDLRPLPAAAREKEARRLAEVDARTALALDSPRLARVQLLRLDDELHWLLLAIHHIIADGWSIGILLRELGELYAADHEGRPPVLPKLSLQPADVAYWERSWLHGEALARQLDFWRNALAGAPHALELPTDFPRPAQQTFRGARLPFRLPAALAGQLRQLGREEGATLFMVLLAAYQILLGRLAGQETVVVGTPVAHREHTELEGLIGFFANTLPLRLDLDLAASFSRHLAQLRRRSLDSFAHQDLPFEKLVAELVPERDLARSPIFQVMFALQNLEAQSSQLGDLRLEPIEIDLGRAQFDLNWVLYDPAGSGREDLEGYFEWNLDLFGRATAERLAERLLLLLEQVAAAPRAAIGELRLEVAADQELRQSFASFAPAPDGPLTPLAIAAIAARSGAAVALGLEGEAAYTYAELMAAAKTLARHLAALGAGRERIVGLSLGRVPSQVVAQLAIWQAGAAYLPLDPLYPADRLAYMFENSGAEILVVDSRDEEAPPSLLAKARTIVDLARLELTEEPGAADWQPLPPEPSSLAYVLYTSGSTGKPKGVLIEHGALANFLASMARQPGLEAADRLVAVTTLSFDIAGLEIWLPLSRGARVDLASRATVQDGEKLAALLERCAATVLQATPATWRLLLAAGWAGRPGLKALCGGEALPGELAQKLLEKVGSLWNVYGPTETTIWSATRELRREEEFAVAPLGRPIAATAIYLLGPDGRPQPPGVAGELCIGGRGLARGYHRLPALTADKFRPDPWAAEKGGRLYHTGDLARLRLDGELEYLGRIDFQVKVRGFRIELGEIEAALAAHPGVAEAVVVARDDGPAGSRLVGYFRPQGEAPATATLQDFLRRSLPEYMVPPVLMALDRFPLTPNLKVDRRALPAPEARVERSRPPETRQEKALAAIWQELLKLDEVGAEDNFFALGGDSIVVIQVVARARQQGLELHPRDLFLAPTLAALAAASRDIVTAAAATPVIATERQGVDVVGQLSDEELADLLDTFGNDGT